jgi:ribosomal-protein-alanine N-acetyltransferase
VTIGWMIRSALPEDAGALAEIEQAAFGAASWGASSVKESIDAPYVTTLLAFGPEDEQPTGFAMWRRLGEEGEILSLGVAPAARRRGGADALLDAIIEGAREKRVAALFLEVDAGNLAARSLYEKHGFSRIGERRGYYRSGADALVLRKSL